MSRTHYLNPEGVEGSHIVRNKTMLKNNPNSNSNPNLRFSRVSFRSQLKKPQNLQKNNYLTSFVGVKVGHPI